MSSSDFYAILGVPRDATDTEIKTAYRQLVKRFHPDSGSPPDLERFRHVQEAYETLSNPDRRRAYDARGARSGSGFPPVSWGGGFEEPIGPLRGFREVFGRREIRPHFDLMMSDAEARRGASAVLEIPRDSLCHACRGSGGEAFGWCPHCRGAGSLRGYERLVFHVPPGVEHGDYVTARTSDGRPVRARVFIR